MMEKQVRDLFERYERSFARGLRGDLDLDEATSFYAEAFVAATPVGVMSGTNGGELKLAIEQGYAHYRAIGTRTMRIRDVGITPIDEHHCVARVAWTAVYGRKERSDVAIDFDVHYLVQMLGEAPLIFGWISGDEREILEKHGIG
ncbi:MAG TPA: nuclear transport factor 2 family protein [Rhizobiaceae bacterium]|nr:nuclear transport factor 2 family protein [Rhizobiaceae bacterium]